MRKPITSSIPLKAMAVISASRPGDTSATPPTSPSRAEYNRAAPRAEFAEVRRCGQGDELLCPGRVVIDRGHGEDESALAQADRLDQRFMPGAREHDHIPGVKVARQGLLLHGAGRYRLAWHSPVVSARPAGVRLACTGSGSWMRQAGTGSVCGPGQVASPGCRS